MLTSCFPRNRSSLCTAQLYLVAILLCPLSARADSSESLDMTLRPGVSAEIPDTPPRARLQVETHGALFVQYAGELDAGKGQLNMAMVQLEARLERHGIGIYVLPRLRVGDLMHPIGEGTAFFHQAYAFFRHPYGELKAGKVIAQFGRAWDFGLYGPLLVNNDMKMMGDLGLSAEGEVPLAGSFALGYALQYSPVDGRSVSLRNAGLISRDSIRRLHVVTLRAEPQFRVGEQVELKLGVSGQRYQAMRAGGVQVLRVAGDAGARVGPVSAFAEVGLQNHGDRVPTRDQAIPRNRYLWTGTAIDVGSVQARYHFNLIHYAEAKGGVELLHQPGLQWKATPHFMVTAEMAFWTNRANLAGRGERGVYLVAGGLF